MNPRSYRLRSKWKGGSGKAYNLSHLERGNMAETIEKIYDKSFQEHECYLLTVVKGDAFGPDKTELASMEGCVILFMRKDLLND